MPSELLHPRLIVYRQPGSGWILLPAVAGEMAVQAFEEAKNSLLASVKERGSEVTVRCDVASQGATEEEALANLREPLELHFEPPHASRPPKVRMIEVEVGAA